VPPESTSCWFPSGSPPYSYHTPPFPSGGLGLQSLLFCFCLPGRKAIQPSFTSLSYSGCLSREFNNNHVVRSRTTDRPGRETKDEKRKRQSTTAKSRFLRRLRNPVFLFALLPPSFARQTVPLSSFRDQGRPKSSQVFCRTSLLSAPTTATLLYQTTKLCKYLASFTTRPSSRPSLLDTRQLWPCRSHSRSNPTSAPATLPFFMGLT